MALVEAFDKMEGEVSAEQTIEMEELARRLAMLLGLGMLKNRLFCNVEYSQFRL